MQIINTILSEDSQVVNRIHLNTFVLTFAAFMLTERVLSIGLNPKHEKYREHHRHEIHDMLKNTYAKIGGYSGHESGSKEESDAIHHDIGNPHHYIKAVRRNNKITSVSIYKNKHGRKSICSGTDKTDQGKSDLKKTIADDHKQKRSWSEVSGALEHIKRKMGVPVIHNKHSKRLTGKEDIEPDENGEHYTRKIGGHRHRKVIMGYPKED